jgi:hypothetical protein
MGQARERLPVRLLSEARASRGYMPHGTRGPHSVRPIVPRIGPVFVPVRLNPETSTVLEWTCGVCGEARMNLIEQRASRTRDRTLAAARAGVDSPSVYIAIKLTHYPGTSAAH